MPVIGELRGDQVVWARGEALGRPGEIRRIREHMWTGLPHAPRLDAGFAALSGLGGTAVTTTLREGPLWEMLNKLYDSSIRAVKNGRTTTRLLSPTSTRTDQERLCCEVRCGATDGAYWVTVEPASADAINAMLEALGGTTRPARVAARAW